MGSLRGLILLAAFAAALGGGALITHQVAANRHHHSPSTLDTSGAVTACQLRVMRNVPAPAPATMDFTQLRIQPAAGGGLHLTGVVDAHPGTGPDVHATWTCDVEQRPTGWAVWYITVTPTPLVSTVRSTP